MARTPTKNENGGKSEMRGKEETRVQELSTNTQQNERRKYAILNEN